MGKHNLVTVISVHKDIAESIEQITDNVLQKDKHIQELEDENKRLQKCHDSELGVCQEHCDEVIGLRKALTKSLAWTKHCRDKHITHNKSLNDFIAELEALKEGKR